MRECFILNSEGRNRRFFLWKRYTRWDCKPLSGYVSVAALPSTVAASPPTGRPFPMRLLLLLKKSKAFWSGAIVLLVGLVVGLVVWGVDPDPNQFLAAVSLNYSTVRIDDVS